jgi:hypothetical protein
VYSVLFNIVRQCVVELTTNIPGMVMCSRTNNKHPGMEICSRTNNKHPRDGDL